MKFLNIWRISFVRIRLPWSTANRWHCWPPGGTGTVAPHHKMISLGSTRCVPSLMLLSQFAQFIKYLTDSLTNRQIFLSIFVSRSFHWDVIMAWCLMPSFYGRTCTSFRRPAPNSSCWFTDGSWTQSLIYDSTWLSNLRRWLDNRFSKMALCLGRHHV